MPLEQLGVKCLAQGHIAVSQWIQTWVSHTKGMCPLCHHHPCIQVYTVYLIDYYCISSI